MPTHVRAARDRVRRHSPTCRRAAGSHERGDGVQGVLAMDDAAGGTARRAGECHHPSITQSWRGNDGKPWQLTGKIASSCAPELCGKLHMVARFSRRVGAATSQAGRRRFDPGRPLHIFSRQNRGLFPKTPALPRSIADATAIIGSAGLRARGSTRESSRATFYSDRSARIASGVCSALRRICRRLIPE